MPGKVNPVIAESAMMVAAQVIGNDTTVTLAGQGGNFELNTMLPVIAYNLLQSIDILSSAASNLAYQCVAGLEATERGPELVEKGLMLATALAPELRQGSRDLQRSLQEWQDHPRGRPRENRPLRGGTRQAARRPQDDG